VRVDAMRAVMLVTDSEAVREFELALIAERRQGFTVVSAAAGSGRQGLKTGDRVHPGGSSLLLTVVAETELDSLLALLRRVRDEAGVREATRMWTFAADEVV
jgi:hypothetical protein